MRDDLTDPTWVAYAKECIGRLEAIRDAFLTGRDAEAVQMLTELDDLGGRTVLGINSRNVVEAGQTVQVECRPQLPFRADRFCVDDGVSRHFLIHDIRVGIRSQFIQSSDLAGAIASSRVSLEDLRPELDEHGFWTIKIERRLDELIGVAIDMPICEVAQDMVVIVTNISTVPTTFRGAFFGRLAGGSR